MVENMSRFFFPPFEKGLVLLAVTEALGLLSHVIGNFPPSAALARLQTNTCV